MSTPDRLSRFLVKNAPFLAAGGLLSFLSGFGQTFFISVFAGQIRLEFGLSHAAWGGLYMLGTTASAIVMVWAGGLSDVFRVRHLGPMVLVALALACLAMALNHSLWALPLVIFALRFFGQGMSSHIALVAMARWFVAARGRALSIASLGFSVAEALLPLGFVAMMQVLDWRTLWLLAAALVLCGAPVLAKLLAQERTPQSTSESNSTFGMDNRHWSRGEVLRSPLFWCMAPALLGPPAFVTAFFFHQLHFATTKGMEHLQLVAFFPLYTGLTIVAMLVSGWALDRWNAVRLMPFYQLPIALAFLCFAAAGGPLGIALGFLFLAMTNGAQATLPNSFWAECYGTRNIGAIKALAMAIMVLGSAIGPGLTGLLIDLGLPFAQQGYGIAAYFLGASALMKLGILRARARLSPPAPQAI